MNLKQIIILRADLNMRKGKMIAQGAHAVLSSLKNSNPAYISDWEKNHFQKKIVVKVNSYSELVAIHESAKAANLNGVSDIIIDEGFTEFNGEKTPTAICIGPDDAEAIDNITNHLRLL